MSRTRPAVRTVAAVAAVAAISAVTAPAASAFEVTRTDDPGLNTCEPGDCSLRGAVIAANAASGFDVIDVPPGTYTLEINRLDPNYSLLPDAYKGDLDISENVTIRPAVGEGEIVVNANNAGTDDRAFETSAGLGLNHVTVVGGHAPLDANGVSQGGGIRVAVAGRLSMQHGGVVGNSVDRPNSQNGYGGGIYAEGAVQLSHVLVADNSARTKGFGGGLYVRGYATLPTIQQSTFRDNAAFAGGGIAAADGGRVIFRRSRLARNLAIGAGGGGAFTVNGGGILMQAASVANNTAAGLGGGVRALEASASFENATVTGNGAPQGGGISINDQPGGPNGELSLINTIVAGNRDSDAADGTFEDCWDQGGGNLVSHGHNLMGWMPNCLPQGGPQKGDQLGGGVNGDEPPILPLLSTEAYWGGPDRILSIALQPQSPAVNAGDESECFYEDIRGLPIKGKCDIGAYERARCGGVIVNRVGLNGVDSASEPDMAPTDNGDGIMGLGMADELAGGGGDDGLCGGADDDTLKGGEGSDVLLGGKGRDICVGGPGPDRAKGCEKTRSVP